LEHDPQGDTGTERIARSGDEAKQRVEPDRERRAGDANCGIPDTGETAKPVEAAPPGTILHPSFSFAI